MQWSEEDSVVACPKTRAIEGVAVVLMLGLSTAEWEPLKLVSEVEKNLNAVHKAMSATKISDLEWPEVQKTWALIAPHLFTWLDELKRVEEHKRSAVADLFGPLEQWDFYSLAAYGAAFLDVRRKTLALNGVELPKPERVSLR